MTHRECLVGVYVTDVCCGVWMLGGGAEPAGVICMELNTEISKNIALEASLPSTALGGSHFNHSGIVEQRGGAREPQKADVVRERGC